MVFSDGILFAVTPCRNVSGANVVIVFSSGIYVIASILLHKRVIRHGELVGCMVFVKRVVFDMAELTSRVFIDSLRDKELVGEEVMLVLKD